MSLGGVICRKGLKRLKERGMQASVAVVHFISAPTEASHTVEFLLYDEAKEKNKFDRKAVRLKGCRKTVFVSACVK